MNKDIDELLADARERSENYGYLYGRKETAEDYVKLTYATLYEDIPEPSTKSVAERDAWVKRQPDYKNALERKRDAFAAWKRAETYMKLLMVEAEVWRTKQANDRYMDKVHQ